MNPIATAQCFMCMCVCNIYKNLQDLKFYKAQMKCVIAVICGEIQDDFVLWLSQEAQHLQ